MSLDNKFSYLEKTITTKYTSMHCKLDDLIPFNEIFVIPYTLWFLYVVFIVALFFFLDKKEYYQCCSYLFIGMTICLLICTIFPNGQNLRPTSFARDNILVDINPVRVNSDSEIKSYKDKSKKYDNEIINK